jgi:dTDP-4-dehydrorhamnose reductase
MSMSRPIVIIGANGQLGSDLMRVWPAVPGAGELRGLTHGEIEVTNLESVRAALLPIRPGLVVNTSAFHRVDEIEAAPERAFAVNAAGPRNLVFVCREVDAVFIHVSTDYVFSGQKDTPYVESDPVAPINMYGISKAAGEMAIRSLWPRHFIVRSSGLYGVAGPSGKGSNFVDLMLRLAREGKSIRVVDDQVLTPTPTHCLAAQMVALSRRDEYGTYHATCQGQCSWFEFAGAIFTLAGLSPDLGSQATSQSGAIAARPARSVLENRNLGLLGIDCMPSWRTGLEQYLNIRNISAGRSQPCGAAAP